jgi:hypothetical protein
MTSAIRDVANLPFPHPRQLPTGDEIRHSKSIIEDLDRNIEDLEQDIRRLQTRLHEVQRKRANYASYISPLRRLPTEILGEIVSFCIHNSVDITVVASICGRLREVALGMSRIWSNISLRCIKPKRGQLTIYRFYERYGSSESVSQ